MLDGHVAVEILPRPKETDGGIILTGLESRRKRPCVGVVLACGRLYPPHKLHKRNQCAEVRGKPIPFGDGFLVPGDIVLVHPDDGKRMDRFELDGYKPQEGSEVRLYGIVCPYRASGVARGRPTDVPWHESVVAVRDAKMDRFRPLGDNVLVELPEKEGKTKSGIELPDSMKRRMEDSAYVVAVGEYVEDVFPGDKVLYERRALLPIEEKGSERLAFIDIGGIYGVLT